MTSSATSDPPDKAASWLPWASAAVLAGIAAVWHAHNHPGELFVPLADEALLVPIALRETGQAAYAGDRWLEASAGIFSIPYSWLIGTLLRFVDDPVLALRWLSVPFHVLFLAGSWKFVERFAGIRAAVFAQLLLVLPPLGWLVFAAGGALPRDLVYATLPWFVLGVLAARDRKRLFGMWLFFALGLLANLHPLTGVHFAAFLLVLGLALDPTAHGFGAAIARGLSFLAGAAPYVVQYLRRPVAPGAVDESVYLWRLGSMAGETLGSWVSRMEPLLWTAAAAALLLFAARREKPRLPRWFLYVAAGTLLLGALGPTLGRFIPPLRAVQLARLDRIAAWCVAVVIAVSTRRGPRSLVTLVSDLCLIVALCTVLYGGAISWLGHKLDNRLGVPFQPRPADLVSRKEPDPTAPAHRADFLAVCRFAATTPPDSLFVVPPEQWAPFRVYARRGVAVTRKEGGAALSFMGARGMEWYRAYAEMVAAYATDSATGNAGLAGKWQADRWEAQYVVLDDPNTTTTWPVVFTAGSFRVLAVPRK